jgi:transposase
MLTILFNFLVGMKTKYPLKKKKFSGKSQEKKSLRQMAFSHVSPTVQRKCLSVLLLMFLFNAALVGRIVGLNAATIRNYWRIYKQGGIKELEKLDYKGSKSVLQTHASSIDETFEKDPPHTISEAAARIEKLTGIKRSTKSVRVFLKRLKFRYRKVASIPAKANIGKQAEFLINFLYPLLREARNGLRTVLFLDAAHFVHGSFLGCLWSKARIFVKAPSGRRRLNILGAVNAITKRLHVLSNETYINSQVLCDFLKEIAKTYVGQPITIVLDNARYQRCELVQTLADNLGIQLLFLPSYSPNLNIIERVWKFMKKKALNSRYYETFSDFQTAILKAVDNCNDEWANELKSLLTLNFQTFSKATHLLPSFDEQFSEEILNYA